MNEKVGLLSYRMDREMFEKPYSNETAHMIDTEVRGWSW
jgi:AFG3 family protein